MNAVNVWYRVADPSDRRYTFYWWYGPLGAKATGGVGEVSPTVDGRWQAEKYVEDDRYMRRANLGVFPSRQRAQRAVERWDTELPCATCQSPALWHDEAFVCFRCDNEHYPTDDPSSIYYVPVAAPVAHRLLEGHRMKKLRKLWQRAVTAASTDPRSGAQTSLRRRLQVARTVWMLTSRGTVRQLTANRNLAPGQGVFAGVIPDDVRARTWFAVRAAVAAACYRRVTVAGPGGDTWLVNSVEPAPVTGGNYLFWLTVR